MDSVVRPEGAKKSNYLISKIYISVNKLQKKNG